MTQAAANNTAPAVIAAAGPKARAAWDQFCAGEGLRPATRKLYRNRARQFLTWLEPQGIDLAAVKQATVESYLDSRTTYADMRSVYGTPVRRLFAALAEAGVVPSNPANRTGPSAREKKTSLPTLNELKGYVRELTLDPIEEGDEDFDAALLLLAALHFGTRRVLSLCRYTGVSPRLAAEWAGRLRANGIWTSDGKTAAEWFEDDGQLAFWLDVWVATGLMDRVDAPPDSTNPGAEAVIVMAAAPAG